VPPPRFRKKSVGPSKHSSEGNDDDIKQRSKSVGRARDRSKSVVRQREGEESSSRRQVPVPPSQDDSRHQRSKSVGRRERSKSVGRGSLTRVPDEDHTSSRSTGRGRASCRDGVDESDRPRSKSIGRGLQSTPKDSTANPRPVKKNIQDQRRHPRSKSIGRVSSGKQTGHGDIPPPKLWDQSRQRSKSIGPRRTERETESEKQEDEFMEMAHSSQSRGNSFFDQSVDSDSEEEENKHSRKHTVPAATQKLATNAIVMSDDTSSLCSESPFSVVQSDRKTKSSSAKIPWDTFLDTAKSERS